MKRFIFFISVTVFLSSCASLRVEVGVNSLGDDGYISPKKCLLIPTNDVASNQLQYDEYRKYITSVIIENGYEITEMQDEATIAIIIDYGISLPQQSQLSYNAPVFGQTGYSSSNTTGTIRTSGNTSSLNTSTRYTPQYGITGYQTVQRTYTSFTRYLKLVTYDYKIFVETKKEKQLWYSAAVSTGSSGDLRLVMPYIIAALKPYIGKNTGKIITVQVFESNEDVQKLIEK